MEGRKFSVEPGRRRSSSATSSSRYDPDPLRYFLTAAGPETQDTDFTWSEFVRRNNDELVANWGNLVNRTLTNAHRNFGAVPEPGELTAADQTLLAEIEAGFDDRRRPDRGRALQGRARARRCASRRASTSTSSEQAPWALDRDRPRARRHRALRRAARDRQPEDDASRRSCRSRRSGSTSCSATRASIAGPLELREVGERRATSTRCSPATTRRWVGQLGAERAAAGPAAARAEPALQEARPRAASSPRSSSGCEARQPTRDRHARAPRRVRGPAVGARRAARARPASTRIVTVGTGIDSSPRRARARRARTRACSRRSASTRTRPASRSAERLDELRELLAHPSGRSPSARPASTTSATTRRATASGGCSRRSSSSRPSSASRSSSTPATPTRRPLDALERLRRRPSSCTASRRRACCGRARARLLRLLRRQRDVPEGRASCAPRPRQVPADRILAETDSPYLAPQPRRGRPNEPAQRRPHGRGARRGARRGRRRARARRSTRTPPRAFSLP